MESLRLEENRIRQAYDKRANANSRYSLFEQSQLFRLQQLERALLALLKLDGLDSLRSRKILEIGCGNGYWLRQFIQWGADPERLTGVDLLEDRVADAKKLCSSGVKVHRANAAKLDFPDASFDLVFQATVFTSILDPDLKKQIAAEMIRVTRDEGFLLWYDFRFNNPWNADVQGVKSREIRELFPDCNITLRRVTLAPPLARRLAAYSWLGCCLLEKIPWLCTHYLGLMRKSSMMPHRRSASQSAHV
jgi:ubiquinone/menaquinone biosynthesis C-methylase UbiE